MVLKINNRQFRPQLLPSILALLFFSLFISLGCWQLDRAEYKRTVYREFVKKNTAKPVELQKLITDNMEKDSLLWRPVSAEGLFGKKVHILLDNQVIKGQAGYFVYSPMKLNDLNKWVLVNRGWLSAGYDRSAIPDIKQPDSFVLVNAIIKELPRTGILLKEAVPEKISNDIIRVQKIDLKELEDLLNVELLPFILRLEPDSEYGYVREWSAPGSGEEMHKGYAFQWFAFATLLFFIFVILSFKKVDVDDNGSK